MDPEKAKLEKGETKDNSNEKTAGGVAKQLILPSSIAKEEPKLSEPEKKKISVGKKFDFKLFDNEHEKKVKEKPPRPPPMSPTSGLKSHHGLSSAVSNKLASTKKMSAPSPPRPSRSRSEIKTFVSFYCSLNPQFSMFSHTVFVDKIVITLLKNRCMFKCKNSFMKSLCEFLG